MSAAPEKPAWLLLIHQIPARPAYFRVKVARRLRAIGAVALKSSVYALPNAEEAREDFHWLLREIVEEGGEATLCEASLLEGVSDEDLRASFRRERAADYEEIGELARAAAAGEPGESDLRRVRARLAEVIGLDFFDSPTREIAEHAISRLEARLRPAPPDGGPAPEHATGRTWVTRRGIRVDRMASAWLIRRFIDPRARFRFVAPENHVPEPGELRFDMFDGEFTHEGEGCTFETLLARFRLEDPALRAVGEVVHDIDCKEERFGREEAAGIAALVRGIAAAQTDDADRLAAGMHVFEALYHHFRTQGS